MAHVVLVGAGNMGFAMLSRWLDRQNSASDATEAQVSERSSEEVHIFSVVEPVDTLRERAAAAGAKTYAVAEQLPTSQIPDVIVIATKPNAVEEIVGIYAPRLARNGIFISIAAGIRIEPIIRQAGKCQSVVRCMPNMPAMIGEGMTVCCASSKITDDQWRIVRDLLSAIGRVGIISDESLMDAVTAVSGSGPAYLFLFIEALSMAARNVGLDDDLALLLAKQTVYGASKLALESDKSPAELRRQVTSPNGTTAAALNVFLRPGNGLVPLVSQAVTTARNRSISLSKG